MFRSFSMYSMYYASLVFSFHPIAYSIPMVIGGCSGSRRRKATDGCRKIDVSLKSGHGEQRDYNKLNYNQFEVSNHEKENI